MDRFGAVTWWGFSPALHLLDEGLLEKARLEEKGEDEALNILLIGMGDIRHIIKTLALSHRHRKPKLKFYIIENSLEVIARHMLLLAVVFEQPDQLGLQEKAELFLELYGNSLIRQQTFDYLRTKCDQFIKFVTDLDYMSQQFSILDLSQLKFKERDLLEGVFKFWRNQDHKTFPIVEMWEQRLRHSLKTRYDSRMGVFDWDYSMRLHDKTSIVYSREYKKWRETGVAFAFREGGYTVPNRSLASGLLINKGGEKVAQRGYWGDMVNSPYIALGIESENEELVKKVNDRHVKTSAEVALYNVTAYIHELLTGMRYTAGDVVKETKMPSRPIIEELDEDVNASEALSSVEATSTLGQSEKTKSMSATDTEFLRPVDVTVTFLPINSAQELHRKGKFHKAFDLVYLSNSMVHNLTEELQAIFAPGASVVIETVKFMLELKKEMSEEYVKKVTGMAHKAGCKIMKPCDGLKDAYMIFKYEH
ncbi:dynein axonemal assembly factor 3-like [Corticium candelabrum]|uniref:dynein axonemal assembly factor 3-like n=1 Tax=Corticium candelabrum TaxID=121492 RepID=UPI002E254D67|nr:dynein axonemal assembly factor 3-like [Corticium candelabrum]